MADIKTKESVRGTVKTIDRAAVVSERIKSAAVRTKDTADTAEKSAAPAETSPQEYGAQQIKDTVRRCVAETGVQLQKRGQRGFSDAKRNAGKARDNIQKCKDAFKGTQPKKATQQAVQKAGKGTLKTAQSAGKGSVKVAQKGVKTAQQTGRAAVKTAQTTAKTAKVTAKASAKAAQKTVQAAKAAAKATVQAVKVAAKATVAAVKAIIAGTKALIAAIAAGGWGAVVVILVLCVVGLIASSCFGIFFSGEDSGTGQTMRQVVQEINTDYQSQIDAAKAGSTYDELEMSGSRAVWPEVLAVFAVHTNLNSDSDVVVINAAQMQRIQDTFWTMHEITYEVEEVDTTPEPTEDDPDPEQQTDYILHITVSSKTVDELAELYNFTQDQNDILHELLSDEMRPTLLALCGGIGIIEDGELCWPLPGHTYISCNFGDDDAYGNSGHRGTDIPAPEGTPILAAHSGTVIISGWNNSYGNQVLLDNGAGLSTRYAHMTAAAVSAGETVTAGQVIGYVGNTGDSTGFHLHFEVMQDGVRVNPMDMVSVR